MKKLKLRKVKGLVQGHIASMEWSQDSNLGSQSHGLPFPLHPSTSQSQGPALFSEETENKTFSFKWVK